MTEKTIAVIGGGLAGLAAAVELKQRASQLDVVLFEAKQATGGRAGSFVDPRTESLIDYCQHVAMGCCTQFLRLMDDAGIADQFTRYRELTFMSLTARPLRYHKPWWLPTPLHLIPFFLQLPHLSLRQKLVIARAMASLIRTPSETLRQTTATWWLQQHGQSQEMIEMFWDVVVASALGETCERVAMHAVQKVFQDGFLASHSASDVYVPKLPLRQLISEHLTTYVQSLGVDIRLGQMVKELQSDQASPGRLRLRAGDQWHTFDAVIIATPAHAMARLVKSIADPKLQALAGQLEQVNYSPITGIHLWFDRPIMTLPHAVFLGTLAQWAFRDPTQAPESTSADCVSEHYVQVVISASHDLRQREPAAIVEQIEQELKQFFPQAAESKLLRWRVVTDPHAVYSLSPEVERLRPSCQTACAQLLLAGDFVQTGWPATMEGAVISGQQAAAQLLAS